MSVSYNDLTETYLERLMAGDSGALLSSFAGMPSIDDPLGGQVRSPADLERFTQERRNWLVERAAHREPVRTTRTDRRTVSETLLHLRLPEQTHLPDRAIVLPVAVVGDHVPGGKLQALRVYHSLWPLFGEHRVRASLLPRDLTQHVADVVSEYQRALAAGDVDAIVATFEPDGYFREPAGGEYIYRGQQRLHEFMTHLFTSGGIGLEHCTVTDDGVACAIEFNAVQFGVHQLTPQAGVAVYERGTSGRLHAARVYDDVNVEALAQPNRNVQE